MVVVVAISEQCTTGGDAPHCCDPADVICRSWNAHAADALGTTAVYLTGGDSVIEQVYTLVIRSHSRINHVVSQGNHWEGVQDGAADDGELPQRSVESISSYRHPLTMSRDARPSSCHWRQRGLYWRPLLLSNGIGSAGRRYGECRMVLTYTHIS